MDAAVLPREGPERDGPREDGEGEQQQQEQPDGRAAEVGGRGRRDAGQRLGEARGGVEDRRGAQDVAQDEAVSATDAGSAARSPRPQRTAAEISAGMSASVEDAEASGAAKAAKGASRNSAGIVAAPTKKTHPPAAA